MKTLRNDPLAFAREQLALKRWVAREMAAARASNDYSRSRAAIKAAARAPALSPTQVLELLANARGRA